MLYTGESEHGLRTHNVSDILRSIWVWIIVLAIKNLECRYHGTKVSKNLISVLCCTRGNLNTDYGRMMSTFQIINGQIMIQAQTFLKKSETFEEKWLIHAKSRTRDEICTESAIKNTPNILRFTWSKNFSHYLALSIWFRT